MERKDYQALAIYPQVTLPTCTLPNSISTQFLRGTTPKPSHVSTFRTQHPHASKYPHTLERTSIKNLELLKYITSTLHTISQPSLKTANMRLHTYLPPYPHTKATKNSNVTIKFPNQAIRKTRRYKYTIYTATAFQQQHYTRSARRVQPHLRGITCISPKTPFLRHPNQIEHTNHRPPNSNIQHSTHPSYNVIDPSYQPLNTTNPSELSILSFIHAPSTSTSTSTSHLFLPSYTLFVCVCLLSSHSLSNDLQYVSPPIRALPLT
jgi:hypothetical protein